MPMIQRRYENMMTANAAPGRGSLRSQTPHMEPAPDALTSLMTGLSDGVGEAATFTATQGIADPAPALAAPQNQLAATGRQNSWNKPYAGMMQIPSAPTMGFA